MERILIKTLLNGHSFGIKAAVYLLWTTYGPDGTSGGTGRQMMAPKQLVQVGSFHLFCAVGHVLGDLEQRTLDVDLRALSTEEDRGVLLQSRQIRVLKRFFTLKFHCKGLCH